MTWEYSVGDGWKPIVQAFEFTISMYKLEGHEKDWIEIVDVKEKYGRLTIYMAGYDEVIEKIIEQVVSIADKTCERCGNPGRIREERPWIKTLCDECNGTFKYPRSIHERDGAV